MLIENILLALNSIISNKMRSFLTTLGILIGVASIITVVALIQGIFASIDQQIQQLGSNIVTIQPHIEAQSFADYMKNRPELTLEDADALKRLIPAIIDLAPVIGEGSQIKYAGKTRTTSIAGVHPQYQEINGQYVEEGRFITDLDLEYHRKVVVLGQEIVKSMKLGERPIGKSILIQNTPFKIVGIMEKRGSLFGRSLDDYALIPISSAIDLYGRIAGHFASIQFRVADMNQLDKVKQQCTTILRRRHKIPDNKPNDFKISTQEDIVKSFSKTTNVITAIVMGIVGISLLVGGIGIMNIMLVTVTERTREIGIRKAVGATRKNILSQFLIEAVTLSFLGGAIGILLGMGLGNLAAHMIPHFPPAHTPIWAILLGFGFSTGIGILFGVYPAGKAAALNPIDALRHE
ncbi:MAG: FtsX-like permease family protein [Acidobacteria bacterium]|nr:FtsX-like permease family protein [Acidobacteriota bacterium]